MTVDQAIEKLAEAIEKLCNLVGRTREEMNSEEHWLNRLAEAQEIAKQVRREFHTG